MKALNRNSDRLIQVGIDIGSTKICCAITELDPDQGGIKLLGVGSHSSAGMQKGSLVHRDQVIEDLERALKEAETMAGLKVNQAVLGLSGEHVRGINTQGAIAINSRGHLQVPGHQEISSADVHHVLDLAKAISLPVDRDILHILPQEYIIDTMEGIRDPVGMTGRRLEARVHLVTVASTAAANLARCIEELGIQVEGLVFHGLASALATLDDDEKKLGVALVDIGASTTDVAVYYDGGVRHTAALGIGASSVTKDIAVMLQVGIEEAEAIKLQYASAKASMSSPELEFDLPVKNGGLARKVSEHELSRYVEARMAEVLQLVGREIARADLQSKLTYGLVLSGGGALLKNITSLAQEGLNLPARIGHPKQISGAAEVATSPIYATALGLAQWKTQGEDVFLGRVPESALQQVKTKLVTWIREFF